MVPMSQIRGLRNNNPGNIDFANQNHAVLEPRLPSVPHPRFAKFDTMEHGLAGLIFQLNLYFSRGIDTVAGIIGKWAPPTENRTPAYAVYVARSMNVSTTQHLVPTPVVLAHLAMAISHFECGANLPFTEEDVLNIANKKTQTLV